MGRVGGIRYSGLWSQANFDEHLGRPHAALRAAQLPRADEPTLSRYNALFTPWFLSRNEIWLSLERLRGAMPRADAADSTAPVRSASVR